MERKPIPFAWHSATRQHVAALVLALGVGGPLALATLLCLRDLVSVLIEPRTGLVPFLRIAAPWPGRRDAIVLAPGWHLPATDITLAALIGLALAALAAAGLGWAVARLCFRAQTRTVYRLNRHVTEAILSAPAGARDEVRGLTQLVGQFLSGMDMLFGLAVVAPAMAGGAVLLALVLSGLAAPSLLPAVALGLLAAGLARALILRRSLARTALRRQESAAAERGLADLVRRMPAVRAHGAADYERARLAAKGLVARRALTASESALAYARAPSIALGILLPALILAAAAWQGQGGAGGSVGIGDLAAAGGAFFLAVVAISHVLRLWTVHSAMAPLFSDISLSLRGFEARRGTRPASASPLPESGILATTGVGAYDPVSGERLAGVTVTVPMPGHVAILGGPGSGSRVLAALLAGQLAPTAGAVTYAGTDLRAFDPAERARRIALAGAEAILIEGTLRQNILYGTAPAEPSEADLIAVLHQTGLDGFVYTRGLEGTVDPKADPELADAVIAARRATREALEADGAAHLVEPFDPGRYGQQATLGENILFGEAIDPAFAGARLARHPYLRAVLEAEGLTRPLVEIGLQVARSTVEIFADLPDDHPLYDAFSLFPADERGFFEDLVARQPEAKGWRRGPAGQRDRERLTGLALLYNETRHRFGLIDEAFEARIVAARRSFRALIPAHLRPGIAFHDPARLNIAASLEENILFGRINGEEAAAETRVRALVRRVLSEQGLEPSVYRLGLASRVEPGLGTGASLGENAIDGRTRIAIDLARCLVRRPDIVVIAVPFEERKPELIRTRLAGLRAARAGSGLIVCLPDAASLDPSVPFDTVLNVERNGVSAAA